MDHQTSELMLEHVRSIYQALTGSELKDVPVHAPLPPAPQAVDWLLARFAELESLRRLVPGLASRVPPFGFVPPVDVVESKGEIVVELDVPGATPDAVEARVQGDLLVISGVRNEHTGASERHYRWTEIPRGPFRRVLPMPHDATAEGLRVDVQKGVLRVHLPKVGGGAVAKA
jgi:HSP20 family protein